MGFDFGSALGSLAGDLGGSFLKKQWSAKEASKQREWSENLSNSAHQREVRDLKAAGLNPILSAGGRGASTPSGATGTVPTSDSIGSKAINSAVAVRRMKADVRNTEATADTNRVNAEFQKAMLEMFNNNPQMKKLLTASMLGEKTGAGNWIRSIGRGIMNSAATVGRFFKKPSQRITNIEKYHNDRSRTHNRFDGGLNPDTGEVGPPPIGDLFKN